MRSDDDSTILAQPFTLLLIETDPNDARLVSQMFDLRRSNVFCDHVATVSEACDHLERKGGVGAAERPDLILLNLNLADQSGHDFLRIRQGAERWGGIPLIAFTASGSEEERQDCLRMGANVYVVKPKDWSNWRVILSALINVHSRRRLC